MIRIFLRAINAPILVLMVILGIAIQTAVFVRPPLSWIQPDVILVAVLWCALKRGFTEGGILTLIFSTIAEAHSSAPQGALLVSYMATYLAVRAAARFFVLPSRTTLIFLTLGASILWRLTNLEVMHLLDASENLWRHTLLYLFPSAMIQGGLAMASFRALERFDWVTHKSARAQQLLEDEYNLDEEGA